VTRVFVVVEERGRILPWLKGRSTVDAIFIQQNVIQHFLNNGKQLFCAFIDLNKAFDSVYRNGLWYKLHCNGVRSKMLQMLKAMYESVKVYVKHCNSYSDFPIATLV
jgi:hypothetical protein